MATNSYKRCRWRDLVRPCRPAHPASEEGSAVSSKSGTRMDLVRDVDPEKRPLLKAEAPDYRTFLCFSEMQSSECASSDG